MRIRVWMILAVCAAVCGSGCQPGGSSAPTNEVQPTQADHGHDHGHSHAELGPNGGHLVELGDEAYHAEWTHDDEAGIVTVYLLDGDAKEPVAIAESSITITTKIEETNEYQLAALNAEGDPLRASQFQIKDPALLVALSMAGESVDASLNVTIDGQQYTGKFEHHDHGHGHHH